MMCNRKNKDRVILQIVFLPIFMIVVVVFLDQCSKYFVSNKIPLYGFINILPNIFNIVHIRNPGGAFGFMAQSSNGMRSLMFTGGSCFIIIVMIFYFRKVSHYDKLLSFGLSLILGGAIGNTIDRLRLGEVIDFIDIIICSYHWPAFNVADSAITIGVIILIYHTICNTKNLN